MPVIADPKLQQICDTFYLAIVLWREARGEEFDAVKGVANVIMNRVKDPKWWGHDVTSVVTKRWQFSSMTDPKDPQLATWPQPEDPSWWNCMALAADVLSGKLVDNVAGANSYYDISIPPPKWATNDIFVKQIGRLRFYKTV